MTKTLNDPTLVFNEEMVGGGMLMMPSKMSYEDLRNMVVGDK